MIDYRDWSVPLGRRFRALKLWFVLRCYGLAGLRALIRRHVALAEWLEAGDAGASRFRADGAPLAVADQFPLRAGGSRRARCELNERLLHALNDEGRIYLTQNRVRGAYAIRVSIGQTTTERVHVEQAWAAIRETAGRLGRP